MTHKFQKDISGCGLSGLINYDGRRVSGDDIKKSICLQTDRGNGLGAGFAAYGIYPDFKEFYALHLMFDDESAMTIVDDYLENLCKVEKKEEIPTAPVENIKYSPILMRYFVAPKKDIRNREYAGLNEDDFIVRVVMKINSDIEGAYVFSSGKNMGAFKGVGFPREIADFFRIEEYEGYIWTAHNRFPTNTPGWWGGAHPFTLLDWSIVHNGEISSYGINKRYLEMFGYKMTLLTDTEVVAYLFDLMVRKHGLPKEIACKALASHFWKDIDKMEEDEKNLHTALRQVYGSGLLNGPFAVLFGFSNGLIGLNDRIKLRPLVVGVKGKTVYMASEESAIREITSELDDVWSPKAGQPVIVEMGKGLLTER